MALPHFTADQALTAAALNAMILASGTSASVPMFVPGENPAAKLNMLRIAASLTAQVPVFDLASTVPILAQLNRFVDAINTIPGQAAAGHGDGGTIVAQDTELLDSTFTHIPAGQQIVTVGPRRGQLQEFLAASFGGIHIKGLGDGFVLDPVTGILSFTGTMEQLTSYLLSLTGNRIVNDLDGTNNPLVFY